MADGAKNRNKIVFMNLMSTIVLQSLTFFSAPIFSSTLGEANYGLVSVYNTWVSIFSTVFTLQAAGTIVIARATYPMEDQEKYQSSVLSMAATAYVLISLIVLLIFYNRAELLGMQRNMLLLALSQGLGSYCVSTINGKFTYEFKAGRNFALSVSLSVCNIGLSLLLIRCFTAENNYLGRMLGEAITYFAFGLFAYIYIFSRGKLFYKKAYWAFTFPIAFPTVFHLLANLLLGQSDRLMLQRLIDNASVGIYTLAASFSTVINAVWLAFNNSWAPFYYEYTRAGQENEMKLRARNYIELFSIVTCGFVLLSREVYHVFADARYWVGTDYIPIFALGYFFVFLYSFPVNFEFYHKKTKLIATATVIAAVTNIILNYVFIKLLGAFGAVLATAIAHGIQFLCHFVFARKVVRQPYPFETRMFVPGFVMVLASCAMFYLAAELWLARWAAGAAMGGYLIFRIIKRKSIF